MEYFVYRKDITPPQDGHDFMAEMFVGGYAIDCMAPRLIALGYVGDLPAEPIDFDQAVSVDGVSYTLGVGLLVTEHLGNEAQAVIAENIVLTGGEWKRIITHDAEAPIVPEAEPWLVSRETVVKRLIASDDFAAVIAVIKASDESHELWNASMMIRSDEAWLLTIFSNEGVDADVILAVE